MSAPRKSIPNDQLWFYHPEMQARITRAEKGFAEGRFTRTTTLQEAQDFLDSLKDAPSRKTDLKTQPKQ